MPKGHITKKSSKKVIYVVHKEIRRLANLLTADTPEIQDVIISLLPDAILVPERLVLSWGISDDPTDERVTVCLIYVRRDQAPADESIMARYGFWIDSDNWRSIGTDAGPVDTFHDRDAVDFAHSDGLNFGRIGGDSPEPWDLVLAVTSSTTSTVTCIGQLTARWELEQITWPDRGGWEEYTDEEVIQNEFYST